MQGNVICPAFIDGANNAGVWDIAVSDSNVTYIGGQEPNILTINCTISKNTEVGLLVITGEILEIKHYNS